MQMAAVPNTTPTAIPTMAPVVRPPPAVETAEVEAAAGEFVGELDPVGGGPDEVEDEGAVDDSGGTDCTAIPKGSVYWLARFLVCSAQPVADEVLFVT
jgi:hypothetical protein